MVNKNNEDALNFVLIGLEGILNEPGDEKYNSFVDKSELQELLRKANLIRHHGIRSIIDYES